MGLEDTLLTLYMLLTGEYFGEWAIQTSSGAHITSCTGVWDTETSYDGTLIWRNKILHFPLNVISVCVTLCSWSSCDLW